MVLARRSGPADPGRRDARARHQRCDGRERSQAGRDGAAAARGVRATCRSCSTTRRSTCRSCCTLFREAGAPPLLNPIIDTLGLARGLFGTGSKSLGALAARLNLPAEAAHRALGDTRTTARLFIELAGRWEREKGVRSLLELAAVSQDLMRVTARR